MPSLGGALLVRVKLPDEVSLVDLPHLVPRDLLHQQQLRGYRVRGQDASAETRGLSAGAAGGGGVAPFSSGRLPEGGGWHLTNPWVS